VTNQKFISLVSFTCIHRFQYDATETYTETVHSHFPLYSIK